MYDLWFAKLCFVCNSEKLGTLMTFHTETVHDLANGHTVEDYVSAKGTACWRRKASPQIIKYDTMLIKDSEISSVCSCRHVICAKTHMHTLNLLSNMLATSRLRLSKFKSVQLSNNQNSVLQLFELHISITRHTWLVASMTESRVPGRQRHLVNGLPVDRASLGNGGL